MEKLDIKIVNGQLVTSAGALSVDVGVKDGKIAAIGDRENRARLSLEA